MIIQTFDCSGTDPRPLQYSHYKTEKERKKLVEQAHADAKQGSDDVWIIDITQHGVSASQIGGLS